MEELGLPSVVTNLAEEQRGDILVTGTTGSGKSTTLAAMIDHINLTLEDPIEYLHEDKARSSTNARSARTPRALPRDAARPAPGPGRGPDR